MGQFVTGANTQGPQISVQTSYDTPHTILPRARIRVGRPVATPLQAGIAPRRHRYEQLLLIRQGRTFLSPFIVGKFRIAAVECKSKPGQKMGPEPTRRLVG